jgi:hypothetical protein
VRGHGGAALRTLSTAALRRLLRRSAAFCRQERTHAPDGRRCNQWYLVDQHGREHLAVAGVEREARDAHYVYHAVRSGAVSSRSGSRRWSARDTNGCVRGRECGREGCGWLEAEGGRWGPALCVGMMCVGNAWWG